MVKKIKRKKLYRKHAVQRIIERTDITFSEIEDIIKHKKFIYLESQTNTRSLCCTKINKKNIFFILRKPNTLITILPEENRRVQKYLSTIKVRRYLETK